MRARSSLVLTVVAALLGLPALVVVAPAAGAVEVGTASDFVTAFEDPAVTEIDLTADIALTAEPVRPLGAPALELDGHGFTITAAADSRVLSSFNPAGALTVRNVTITGGAPTAGQGAGIAWGGEVELYDSVIADNHAYLSGGAVYATGDVTVVRSTLTANSASTEGAAVFVHEGSLALLDSHVELNTDSFAGDGVAGALYAYGELEPDAGRATLEGAWIRNNAGAGLVATRGATLTRSAVTNNGVHGVLADGDVVAVESTVHGNGGYGVGTDFGDITLSFSTITGNEVGLLLGEESTLELVASVVGESDEVNCVTLPGTTVAFLGWNVVDDLSCGTGGADDLVEDGIALLLGEIAVSVGATASREPLVGSPVLDLVPLDACEGEATDQRGVARPQGPACDSGAVELAAQVPPTTPPDGPGPSTPTGPSTPGSPSSPTAPSAQPVAVTPTYTG